MFKVVFLCVFFAITASATHYEEFNNFIDYGSPYGDIIIPYPYQDNQLVIKPHADVIVPALPVTEVGYSHLGLVVNAASFAVSLVKKLVVFLFVNAPALILGTLAAFGICKFTPICSICSKLSSVQSLYEVPTELRSFATPERLASATDFVRTAIRKYRSLQEKH